MKRKLIALLLVLTLTLSMLPLQIFAAEGGAATCVTINDYEVYPGWGFSITIRAQNFVNVASLDLELYYDSSAFRVTGSGNGYLLEGSLVSVYTEQPGKVKLSATSLDGISGSDDLLTIYFETLSDCEAGVYTMRCTVGDAYDTGLNPVAISGGTSKVTVRQYSNAGSFYMYGYTESYEAKKGDTVLMHVCTSWEYPFVSGEFALEYDKDLFAVESVELSYELQNADAVYSVNTGIAGSMRMAYASQNQVSTYELFTVKLKVIGDVEQYTELRYSATNIYHEDLTPYLPTSGYTTMQLHKLPEVVDYPNAFMVSDPFIVGRQAASSMVLEAGANVAAADFVVSYDPQVLRCVGVKASDGLSSAGGMVVVNDNYQNGTIRFSYVNTIGYWEQDLPLITITWEPLQSPKPHYQIMISGEGIIDIEYHPMGLEYITGTGCIYQAGAVKAPTCTEPGYTEFVCSCGAKKQMDHTDPLGHDYSTDHFVCARCGHERKATSITWKTKPAKLTYVEKIGTLDVSGGVITVSMDDGKTVDMSITSSMVSGFDNRKVGKQTLTVTYRGYKVTYDVTIEALIIGSYSLVAPSRLVYLEGESLDLAGGGICVHFTNGGSYTELIPLTASMVSGYDPNKVGKQVLTVTYEGNTFQFTVEVMEKSVEKIEIIQLPAKLKYLAKGDALDVTGGKLKVYFNNGAVRDVDMSLDMISGFDNTVVGKQVLTVTVGAKTATFEIEIVKATVIFRDHDGKVIAQNSYCYGDKIVVPADPTRAADNVYTYRFAGWDPQVVATCTGDAVYTATYEAIYREYTVVFRNWDGSELSRKTYHYGNQVSVPADPTRPADNTYTYTFAGWDKEVVACAGDAVYTATYTPSYIDYTVTFKNWDGTVLSQKTYHYGEEVVPPQDPTRPGDHVYRYIFAGWDKKVVPCAGDAVYTATFTSSYVEYTITFMDWDNSVIAVNNYHYGDQVVPPPDPIRAADNTYTYTFAGWDREIEPCTYDTVYFATYTSSYIDYTVTFKNWDGTIISSKSYHYGDPIEFPPDPTRPEDENYTYTFNGWGNSSDICIGNAEYTAQFTAVAKNANGWVLEDGVWYYYENGKKVTNDWRKDSRGWCYLLEDGRMATNMWIRDSVGWCYVGSDGYCVTDEWVKDSYGWCYLNSEGRMATNKWILDSVGWCYVGADGYCVTDCWKKDSVGWVYLDHNGRMVTNRWVMDSVGWCYVGADGYAVTNCWKKDSVGWCYLNSEGSMTKSDWVLDGGKWYYLNADGYMVTGRQVIDGKVYYFDDNGVWIG